MSSSDSDLPDELAHPTGSAAVPHMEKWYVGTHRSELYEAILAVRERVADAADVPWTAVVEVEPYDFMLRTFVDVDEQVIERVPVAASIHRYVDDVLSEKPTKQTFSLEEFVRWHEHGATHAGVKNDPSYSPCMESKGYTRLQPELFELAGSWTADTDAAGNRRFVNPHGVHNHTVADGRVRCQCGARVATLSANHDDLGAHADECRQTWRLEARYRHMLMRHVLFLRGVHLGLTMEQIARRVTISPRALTRSMRDWGYDWPTIRQLGMARRTATWLVLAELGYTHYEIADAFGVSQSLVTRYCDPTNTDAGYQRPVVPSAPGGLPPQPIECEHAGPSAVADVLTSWGDIDPATDGMEVDDE